MSENSLYEINDVVLMQKDSPYYMISQVLSCIPCIEYWSHDALEEMLLGIVEMIVEVAEEYRHIKSTPGPAKARFTRFVNKGYKIFIPKNRRKLVNAIYEIILKGHRLSTFSNFGFVNKFGDEIKGNPEKDSMVDIIQDTSSIVLKDGSLLEMKRLEDE